VKDGFDSQSTANFDKLERVIKKSGNTFLQEKFNEFKKVKQKTQNAGSAIIRYLNWKK